MERSIAGLADDGERGTMDRRQFCQNVALTAAMGTMGSRARAAESQGFKVLGVNHISYACADYRKARDFYASVFGMEIVPHSDNGREARLMFGPPPGKGGTFLIPRNASIIPKAKAMIDDISYTIPNGDEAKVRAAMKAKGYVEPTERDGSLHVRDPFDFDVQLANADAASIAPDGNALKVALVNHISYTCDDFRKTADWYSKIFNLDQIGETATEIVLPFGKMGEKPFGVTVDDVPLTRLIIRARDAMAREEDAKKPKSRALINHIAYTIADFDGARVRAELKRLGYDHPLKDGEHSFHIVDPNGFDVQIGGLAMNALGG